jgi:hypothetical protein
MLIRASCVEGRQFVSHARMTEHQIQDLHMKSTLGDKITNLIKANSLSYLLSVGLDGRLRPGAGHVVKQRDDIKESLSHEAGSLLEEIWVPVHVEWAF